jgi:hypothetical protein
LAGSNGRFHNAPKFRFACHSLMVEALISSSYFK